MAWMTMVSKRPPQEIYDAEAPYQRAFHFFYFSFGYDMTVLNLDPRNLPLLDPKDQALLLDPAGSGLDFG